MQNYELLQLLGKGSYGKVYTARNYEDHQLYVLKRIPVDSASRGEAEAALREAHVLGLLRHPHIVPYKEFFNYDGDLCLIMAHCEGGDLFQHIKALRKAGKAVDEDQVWQWLVQLLLALSYCHSKKILHRDVKTQNVFLTRDGRLMLGDFGLAKQLQRTLEMARTPIGTPYYMAPEIYEEAPYSFKSDVWALGCVMYEVLTGRPAFAADNLSRVVIRVLKGTFDPLPSTFSHELRDIVASMLTKDVSQRPTANDLLQHPSVVVKVQAYLDQLSKAGAQGGWSTWRMKLPPGILVQMANIISEAARSRPASAAAHPPAQQPQGSPNGAAAGAALSRLEHLMSSTELIEGFGLQSLLEGHGLAAEPSASGEGSNAKALLAATLHPEDRKRLALPGPTEDGITELHVLKSQMNAVRSCAGLQLADPICGALAAEHSRASDPFSGPAAQLLGATQKNSTNRKCPDGTIDDAGPAPDFALLSAGLPKAGFGFKPHQVAAGTDVDTPRLKSGAKGALVPTSSLRKGANGGSPLAPFIRASLGDDDSLDERHGGNGNGYDEAEWKLGTSMRHISLHDTLTNRAAFLRKELEGQLGRERLAAAMLAVQELHDAAADCGGDVRLQDVQAALERLGAASQQLDSAPLLDELVLLQERCYAG